MGMTGFDTKYPIKCLAQCMILLHCSKKYIILVNDNTLSTTTFDTIMRHIDANLFQEELQLAA